MGQTKGRGPNPVLVQSATVAISPGEWLGRSCEFPQQGAAERLVEPVL